MTSNFFLPLLIHPWRSSMDIGFWFIYKMVMVMYWISDVSNHKTKLIDSAKHYQNPCYNHTTNFLYIYISNLQPLNEVAKSEFGNRGEAQDDLYRWGMNKLWNKLSLCSNNIKAYSHRVSLKWREYNESWERWI